MRSEVKLCDARLAHGGEPEPGAGEQVSSKKRFEVEGDLTEGPFVEHGALEEVINDLGGVVGASSGDGEPIRSQWPSSGFRSPSGRKGSGAAVVSQLKTSMTEDKATLPSWKVKEISRSPASGRARPCHPGS